MQKSVVFNLKMDNKKHTSKANNKSILITPDEKRKHIAIKITDATMTNFKRKLNEGL